MKIKINKRKADAIDREVITSGSVGMTLDFEFSEEWDNLDKTAVFIGSGRKIAILLSENTCVIPWECLSDYGGNLTVGVCGTDADEIVIPTVYADCGYIFKGANPSCDPSTNPTFPVWEQIRSEIPSVEGFATEEYVDDAVEAVREDIPSLDGYATEEWVEDQGYLTEHQSLSAYRTSLEQDAIDETFAKANSVYSKTEADAKFLTEHQDLSEYAKTVDVDAINEKIPSQATSTNKLADKAFVNSSIATNTAYFRGTFDSVEELEAYSGEKTLNDYAFVIVYSTVVPSEVEAYDRYKWNGTAWVFEYELNNSSFTSDQWQAINSGITSGDVALIETALQPSALNGYATQSWVEAKGYLTEHQSLSAYRTAAAQDAIDATFAKANTVYTKTEADAKFLGSSSVDHETWTFTLESGSTVSKEVVLWTSQQ